MKIKEIKKQFGVVYNSDNQIEALKRPNNSVYPSKDSLVFECDTETELQDFISKNGLTEKQALYEYPTENN